MKHIFTLIFLWLILLSPVFGEVPNREPDSVWHACENAGDCTIVNGFCNNPEAVNRRYRDQYEDWVKSSGPAACTLLPPPQSICITCQQSRCVSKIKRAKPVK
jgi:hypothetical protein